MRPWQKVVDPSADHLVMEGNQDDRAELQVSSLSVLVNTVSETFLKKKIILCDQENRIEWVDFTLRFCKQLTPIALTDQVKISLNYLESDWMKSSYMCFLSVE